MRDVASFAKVQTILDTNFKSMWLGYSAAATQMIKQDKGGRIIGTYLYPKIPVKH